MTLLTIFSESGHKLLRSADPQEITTELSPHAISFGRWPLAGPAAVAAGASREQVTAAVLAAYREPSDRLAAAGGYRLVDIAHIRPDTPGAAAARAKFLSEHVHDEDEVRFFAAGRGCFYLHLHDRVYAVACEAGDLLSVPAGTRHWFDTGSRPSFTAIRFFQEEDGWVGHFTGQRIADLLPGLDELLEPTA